MKKLDLLTNGTELWRVLKIKQDSCLVIDYLESVLIDKAVKINRLDCDNKNKGNNPKVSKFQKVVLDQYLDEALFLMQLISDTIIIHMSGQGNYESILVDPKPAMGTFVRCHNQKT